MANYGSLLPFTFTAKSSCYGNIIIKEMHQPNAILKPKIIENWKRFI
jgi:hypothetical protein